MASIKNVMKVDTPLYYDDFQKYRLAKAYDKLYDMTQEANTSAVRDKEAKRVYNLSLRDIYTNFFTTMVKIMNEIIDFIYSDNKSFNRFMNILTVGDRMVYVGLFLVLLSIIVYFITQSEPQKTQ